MEFVRHEFCQPRCHKIQNNAQPQQNLGVNQQQASGPAAMQAARTKWYSDLTRTPEQIAQAKQNMLDRYAAKQVQHTTEGTERQFGLTKATAEQNRQQLVNEGMAEKVRQDQATAQAAETQAKQTAAEGQKLAGEGAKLSGQGKLAEGNVFNKLQLNDEHKMITARTSSFEATHFTV
jgi:hypothetical protein